MRKYLLLLLLLCMQICAQAQISYRYWFDNDESTIQEGTSIQNEWRIDVDVSSLTESFHQFQFQVIGKDGKMSSPVTRYFVKTSNIANTKVHYWVDDERDKMQTFVCDGSTHVLDMVDVADGLHLLHAQLDRTAPSSPVTQMFIKIPQTEGVETLHCVCSIDGVLKKQEDVPNHDGVLNWILDVADIPQGFHHIMVQVITPNGAGSSMYDCFFLRSMTSVEQASMKCIYSVDGGEHKSMSGSDSDGLFHFDLDVADIKDGLHNITYMLVGENGVSSQTQSAFFWKTPIGGNGVTSYSYWLNDQTDKHEVKLAKRTNPFELITLVPVDKMPMRSSCFDFKVESGVPVMYAKNDIHFEFVDASGFVSTVNAQYVDGSVKKNVAVSKELTEVFGKETFNKPVNNAIQWYSMLCEEGDSISVQSSQATSIQIFAPSGKEVYNVSGSESVVMNGIHVRENGTYYFAIHDVTASQSQMTLKYQHIDKYAILDWDVHTIGNGGCSTITFNGNGFDELESVSLQMGSVVLDALEVGHESDATTSVKFDFTDVLLGKYKAVFKFKDETKTVENCITVEQAKDIEIAASISFPTSYLRSSYSTYTIKLLNKGNMSAYNVPLLLSLYSNENNISKIKIDGYDVLQEYKNILGDSYNSVADSIATLRDKSGDLFYFFDTENTSEYEGKYSKVTVISPTIKPYSTLTLKVQIWSTSKFSLYSWCGDPNENINKTGRKIHKTFGLCPGIWLYNKCIKDARSIDSTINPRDVCGNPPPNCPPYPGGGGSNPVNSLDPNDIYGYLSESGSKFVADSITALNYRIEFENDTTFATASAHTVIVKDTLDATKFDLSSYKPTSIKIGDKDVLLNGDKQFVTTVDMRPSINAIAQVEGLYDEKKGIATWKFISLDPMTMEETDDVMQGFLPINFDGNGIGEVAFNIDRLQNLADGTEINNKASIVFDTNDAILTPVWTNTIDAVAPTSKVTDVEMKNDSTFTIHFEGDDARSGIWKYDVYYRWKTDMDWICIANGCDSTAFDKTAVAGYTYQFCVVATDSAGNAEQKSLTPEFEFYTGMLGDVNKDTMVTVADVSGVISLILEEPGTEAMNVVAADVNRDGHISVADASGVVSIILGMPLESKARRSVGIAGFDDSVVLEPVAMDMDATVEVPVRVSGNVDKFTSVQFDVTLPQGVSLVGVKGVNEHLCSYSKIADKTRILSMSHANAPFATADDCLVTLVLKVSTAKPTVATMLVEGIELVTPKLMLHHPASVTVPMYIGGATDIDGVDSGDGEHSVYDLNGRRVKEAQNGVYIKDGKSVLVK